MGAEVWKHLLMMHYTVGNDNVMVKLNSYTVMLRLWGISWITTATAVVQWCQQEQMLEEKQFGVLFVFWVSFIFCTVFSHSRSPFITFKLYHLHKFGYTFIYTLASISVKYTHFHITQG